MDVQGGQRTQLQSAIAGDKDEVLLGCPALAVVVAQHDRVIAGANVASLNQNISSAVRIDSAMQERERLVPLQKYRRGLGEKRGRERLTQRRGEARAERHATAQARGQATCEVKSAAVDGFV